MRRAHIILVGATAGLALLWVLLFAVASRPASLLAAPQAAPPFQLTTESEPNNDFDAANWMNAPGSITGSAWNSVTDTDYFSMTTLIGHRYEASLVINSPLGLSLRIVLYDANRVKLGTSSASSSNTSLTWPAPASTGYHYIRVEPMLVSTSTLQIASYSLVIDELPTTATPSVTPTPTNTPLPGADAYEPNNSPGYTTAYNFPVATTASATDANFVPSSETDCYGFYVRNGGRYQAYTTNLSGVDTFMRLYDRSGGEIASDNDGGGGFASKIEWTSTYGGTSDSYYYVCITNQVSSTSADTYDLIIAELSAAATATPLPTATAVAGLDSCENNFDFDHACVIPGNQSMNFNLISPFGGPDNDYFKIWIKPGLRFDCKTSDLSAGVDPNMIVYDQNRNGIGGNDDVSPGNYNSAFSYFSTYEGWLYVLVGTGNRTPSNLASSNYTLRCDVVAPGTPTPIPTNTPRPTSQAPTSAPPVLVTATPPPGLTWRLLTTPPASAVATPAAPRFIPISLLVYYDANDDSQPGAGEGIAGVSAQAYDATTGQLLAQGFTSEQGNLEFTVASVGSVRVSVPFFGFNQLVTGEGASIYLRVPSQSFSGGAP